MITNKSIIMLKTMGIKEHRHCNCVLRAFLLSRHKRIIVLWKQITLGVKCLKINYTSLLKYDYVMFKCGCIKN